ncbi:S2-RNase [Pyrus ussuriensis x Pyrus communis]|uniref:S2-RNase n=1 Tax=Pyrus ussuriensis x Pyrus communis TaxID=2448454 RepID=A0A5N5G221_9ROSA|nr:S2-RNase [Pyrus ussuriensis x Pyrus communis]
MVEVEIEEPSKGKAIATEVEKTLTPEEGYVREYKVNRMLVDGGSAINIMPKSTMTIIGIKVNELSLSRLLIQGFNQGGQKAMGMIRVEMTIGELKSSTIFHVIDARTSYSLLLGRPWIHANGVVPSTLHQCLKFYREGVKVIQGDTKPFTEAESHFADAKFYMDEDMVPEALPEDIRSTGKAAPTKQEWQVIPKMQKEQTVPSSSKDDDEFAKPATTKGSRTPSEGPNAPIFRYIPMSRRKNALPKKVESSFLPTKRTEEGFDPNAYKLMSKAGYDFASSAVAGKKVSNTVNDEERNLTKTQKKLKEHGYGVDNNKAGLGFTPNAPLIEAGFIREVQYPKWISNIVIVLKKSGQIRVCVDFRDLNDACPKDDFPLPIIEIMVDATTGHEALSFMDGSSGYNQIRMALEDEELTAFRTPKGIYCYKVRKDDLVPYFRLATQLLRKFEAVTLEHVPRKENQMADALANLASTCQFHANFIHQPPEPLHPTVASWPFDAWGLDVVGPITPKSSAGEAYILAATDYFSKWAEAIPLREVKKETVVRFIKEHIIHRYGVPRYIITDNGKQFSNRLVDELCDKYKFKQHKSSMYHAPANGLAEAFNKTLCNLLKKVIGRTKRDWHERITVLPLESQIPSLRMAIQEGLTDEENAKLRLQELEALDERRLEAQQHLECYQARVQLHPHLAHSALAHVGHRARTLNTKSEGLLNGQLIGPYYCSCCGVLHHGKTRAVLSKKALVQKSKRRRSEIKEAYSKIEEPSLFQKAGFAGSKHKRSKFRSSEETKRIFQPSSRLSLRKINDWRKPENLPV